MEIAFDFAIKSIELHDTEQYHDWLEFVKLCLMGGYKVFSKNEMKSILIKSKPVIYISVIIVGITILLIAPERSFMLFEQLARSYGGSYSEDQKQLYLYGNYEAMIFIGKAFIIYGFASLFLMSIKKLHEGTADN